MARPKLPGRSLTRPLGNQGPRRMFATPERGNRTRLTGPLRSFYCGVAGLRGGSRLPLPNSAQFAREGAARPRRPSVVRKCRFICSGRLT
jgi:hypothetical protein